MVRDAKFFRAISPLQYFNVQSDRRRAEILGSIDYIAASKGDFEYYYLKWDPLERGQSDPFRAAVLHAKKGKPVSVYGYRLLPIETSRAWTVLKVEPELSTASSN